MSKLNPTCKLLGLLVLTFVLAFWHDPVLNLAFFLFSLGAILCSGTRVGKLLLLLSPVLLAAAGMFFTGFYFSAGGGMPVNAGAMLLADSRVWNGLTLASRVLAFAGMGYLYCLTTDRILMVKSFQKQLRVPQIFAYGLLAAWGIFPHMMQEYRRTRAAFRARGKNPFPVSPTFLKPLLVKSVRWSEQLAVAMESKGFDGHGPRLEYEPVRVYPRDWVFLVLCCLVLPALAFLWCGVWGK